MLKTKVVYCRRKSYILSIIIIPFVLSLNICRVLHIQLETSSFSFCKSLSSLVSAVVSCNIPGKRGQIHISSFRMRKTCWRYSFYTFIPTLKRSCYHLHLKKQIIQWELDKASAQSLHDSPLILNCLTKTRKTDSVFRQGWNKQAYISFIIPEDLGTKQPWAERAIVHKFLITNISRTPPWYFQERVRLF